MIVLPAVNWGDREDAPGEGFEILGVPRQGTHAERVVVPARTSTRGRAPVLAGVGGAAASRA